MFYFGSLALGLIAWILPGINLMRFKDQKHDSWVIFSIMSLSACAISLCIQIINTYHLIKIEDWAALLDTMGALVFVAAVLLIVTLILNTVTLIVYRNRTAK